MLSSIFIELLLQAEGNGAAEGAAEGEGGGGGLGGGSIMAYIWLGLLLLLIWQLLVFRPAEARKRKARERKINSLQKGARVLTNAGMYGKVMKVEDNEVVLQIDKDKDVRVSFAKNFILDVAEPGKTADGANEGLKK